MEVLMQGLVKEMLVLIIIITMVMAKIVGIKGLIWTSCFQKGNNMLKVKGMV